MSLVNISWTVLEAAWNRQDFSLAEQYIHPDHRTTGPMSENFQGLEGFKAFVETFVGAFPDVQVTLDDSEEDEETATLWVTYVGTHSGNLMNIPPSGNEVTVEVKVTDRYEDGRIVESWTEWDPEEMMRQIGMG